MIDNKLDDLKAVILDAQAKVQTGMGTEVIAEAIVGSEWFLDQLDQATATGRDAALEKPEEPTPTERDPMPWKSKLQETRFPKEPSHESTEFLPRRGYLQDRKDYA